MFELDLDSISEIRRLDPETRVEYLMKLDLEQALSIFENLEPVLQEEILQLLPEDKVDYFILELDPDDRVRLLDSLSEERAKALMQRLSPREWRMTQKLMSYPEESAGHIMTPEYLPLTLPLNAEQAMFLIKNQGKFADTIDTLPVIDSEGVLLGMLPLSQLVTAKPEQLVSDLMSDNVVSALPETDQEEVARLIQDADILALPIVNENGKLLGLVTIDDALDVLHLEREEDFARAAASQPLNRPYFTISAFELTWSRLTWLTLLALAGALTVQVLSVFEGELEQVIALSLFIPLLIGVGGNSGAQSATTVTRAIATDDLANVSKVIRRETGVGLMLGSAIGILAYLPVLILFDLDMASVVSVTLVIVCTMATMVGSGMPLLAKRLGIDPAVVSAPVVTTVVDASGLIVYFLMAKMIMGI